MKKYLSLILVATLAVSLMSCEKDENRITLESWTAPVLKASSTAPIVLNQANESDFAIKFEWTNPNYRFTTGISSQDVTYFLEADTTGANFTSKTMQQISISKDLEISFNVKDFNAIFAKMDLLENVPHDVEFRIKSTINGAVPVYSNVVKMRVTPYLDVAVVLPHTGELFITGSATPASWMGGGDPDNTAQKFTKKSSSLFEITINLNGGGSYLFVPDYGDWGNKFGYVGANNQNNVNGDEFKKEGGDILAPPASGSYKIEVNFKTGRFTVTKQ